MLYYAVLSLCYLLADGGRDALATPLRASIELKCATPPKANLDKPSNDDKVTSNIHRSNPSYKL